MKRTVTITVTSDDGKISCSEKFEWDTSNDTVRHYAAYAIAKCHQRLCLVEAQGPWNKPPPTPDQP